MKKYFYTILLSLLFLSGYLEAQVKVWQPYLRFRCDGGPAALYNPAEANFLLPGYEGQQGGQDHRYVDGTGVLQYYFNLTQFQNAQNQHPLSIRVYLWGEYVVEVSGAPMSSTDGGATGSTGTVVAQYAPGPPWTTDLTDGSNGTWVDIPLQQYYDIGQTDVYLAFFDGKYSDGWGPSVQEIGLWYQDTENAGTGVVAVESNDNTINISSDLTSWPSATQWVTIKSGSAGITSVGTVSGLSAQAGISFDPDDIYFGADVTDATVTNSDSVVFYFGAYDITDSLSSYGHLAFVGDSAVTGYRLKNEPDYRFIVTNMNGTPTLTLKLIDTSFVPANSSVNVTKTSTGYRVVAQILNSDLKVPTVIQNNFKLSADAYYPFAVKIVDGSTSGSLITGSAANVDNSPTSWGLKTLILDKTSSSTSNVAQGIIKTIIPGGNDSLYIVSQYKGSSNSNHRWADGTDTIVFHFNLAQLRATVPNQHLFASFNIENEYVINTSTVLDTPRTQVGIWNTHGIAVTDGSNNNDFEVALPDTGANFYVWFTDGIPTDGWGPAIHNIKLYYKGVFADSNLVAFTPGAGDQAYLVADTGSGKDGQHRWADGNNSFGYEFDLANLKSRLPSGTTPYFNVHVGNMWVLAVAKDSNATQYPLDSWDPKGIQVIHDESNLLWHSYSLQPYIDSGWTHVVFFFRDGSTNDGWGPSVRDDFSTDIEQPGVKITYRQILAFYTIDEFAPSDPITTAEANYLVQSPDGYTGSGVGSDHRWADATTVIAYRFIKNDLLQKSGGVNDIAAQFDLGNEYVIWTNNILDTTGVNSTLTNPGNLKMVYEYNHNRTIGLTDLSNEGYKEINLSDYFKSGMDTVYVFFTDGKPDDGWGPDIHYVKVGAYKSAVISAIKKDKNALPSTFALNQNYPNPFNPSTTISYDIPQTGKVVLKIYNILGQEVKTLLNNVVTPGRYQMTWNGDNNFGRKLASGIYLYQMIYNKQQVVKKMVLLK